MMASFNKISAVIIEQITNRVLSLDAEANHKLLAFENKIIHINISDFNLNFYFTFPAGSIVILESCQRKISASITGKSTAFIAAANNANSADTIFTGELTFSGEINTARRFQEFALSLNIDWQEPINQIFGDIFGQNLSQGLSSFHQFMGRFINNLHLDIPEFLQHEVQLTPNQSEVNLFLEQVDTTRSQTDRLDARIHRLRANH